MSDSFWDQPDVVEHFAEREADHRLQAIVNETATPSRVRVLDLGCAGGRNTRLLAEKGFDVWAIDASVPMVERTRSRIAPFVGAADAEARARVGRMDDLSAFEDSSIDLVIALGIYHNARSLDEWRAAVGETVRVLAPGGRLLVNHFTPEVDLTGDGVRPVPDRPFEYDGFPGGRTVLMELDELDAALEAMGLEPEVPSEVVRASSERGRRVSVNALYRKVR